MTKGSTDAPGDVHSTGDFVGGGWSPAGDADPNVINNNEAFDVLFGGESEEWPEQTSSKGFRASWTVTVLVALLLIVSGLALGAFLQRGRGSSPTPTTSPGGRFGGGAFAGAPGAGSATSGTVTDIIGNTLYVTNASGALVAVKVSSSTTIDRNASASLSTLKPGDTVTVQGPTAKNGSVQAATVTATAKGVTPTGGFGGGFGGSAPGGSSASSSTGSKTRTSSGSSASAGA
ncbi:MAG TPA: hypothetical protein VNF05_03070 [Acidimicrobiales bacterium]|nr:hypothetical protein [Acidimicrobiales bacterium]